MFKLFLKKIKKPFLIGIGPFIALLLLGVIPTSYDVTVPAVVSPVRDVYSFEEVDTKDIDINTVSVMVYYKVSVIGLLTAKTNPYAVVEKHNNIVNTSSTYEIQSGTIQKNVSLTNALIAGYKMAGKTINTKYYGAIIHSIYGKAADYFKIGDIITKVEDIEITEEISVSAALLSVCGTYEHDGKLYYNFELNKPYNFEVLRNNVLTKVTCYCFPYENEGFKQAILGIAFYDYYKILSTEPKCFISNPDSYGPSGGLMQALYIYYALSGDQSYKNLKIIGTGTVDALGNAGAIGGAPCKVACAYLNKGDIFFCPEANYEEAYDMAEKLNLKMRIVSVKNLENVLDILKGGNPNE